MGKWSDDPVWGTLVGDGAEADKDVTLKMADNGEWLVAAGHLEGPGGGVGDITNDVPHAHCKGTDIWHDVTDHGDRWEGSSDVFGEAAAEAETSGTEFF